MGVFGLCFWISGMAWYGHSRGVCAATGAILTAFSLVNVMLIFLGNYLFESFVWNKE